MATNKTLPTDMTVEDYIATVQPVKRAAEADILNCLFCDVTGFQPVMWGASIIGYGRYHYRYASGREGDMALTGFSPRKQALTLYIMDGFEHYEELLAKLGKYTTGASCLYIKRLEEIDIKVLRELVAQSYAHMKASNTH